MALGVTDDQNYSNIAGAIRSVGAGMENQTFTPGEMGDAIRGLISYWGNIHGTLSNQADLQSALDAKANNYNPSFTGTPLAPTAAVGNDSTQIATTAFVQLSDNKTVRVRIYTTSATYVKGEYAVYQQKIYKLVGAASDVTGVVLTTPDPAKWDLIGDAVYTVEAPKDNKTYGRRNGEWSELDTTTVDWGEIHGTLSNQTDLQNALNAKANSADLGDMAAENDAPSDGKTYGRKNGEWSDVDASIEWGDISGTLSNQTDLQTALNSKTDVGHIHDDRYYTETEMDAALALKANTADLGSMADVNDAPFDNKTYGRRNGEWSELDTSLVEWGEIGGTLSDQTDLQIALDEKLDAELTTITGDILTFEADNDHALADLKVAIDPVQDLHGYDNPWPEGGGKNLIDYTTAYEGAPYGGDVGTVITLTPSSKTLTINNNTISCTVSGNWQGVNFITRNLSAGTYHFHCNLSSTPNSRMSIYTVDGTTNAIKSKYVSTSSTIIDRDLEVENNDYVVLQEAVSVAGTITFIDLQVESGSAYTLWAPYSNICPISGFTGANVVRTGKNLCNNAGILNGYYDVTNNGVFVASNNWKSCQKIRVRPNTKYYVSGNNSTSGTYTGYMIYWDENGALLSYQSPNNFIITPAKACWMAFYTATSSYSGTMQIEEGNSATEYEPFGLSLPISWQTEAGTVYGGELDVTSGVLTVTHKQIDLGDCSWIYYSNTGGFRTDYVKNEIRTGADPKLVCSQYKNVYVNNWLLQDCIITGWASYTSGNIIVKDTRYSDVSTFKTAMDGVKCVYPLAEPLTYQLTPHQISTLLGTNHLWCDTGDSTAELRISINDVYSKLDTKADADVITVTATSMVAPQNLTAGDLIYVNGNLYKASSNIASGTALTVGTNVTATTVEAEMKLKANSADVYTRSQTYTKTEANTLLDAKADKSDTYTKAEVDYSISQKNEAIVKHTSGSIVTIDDGANGILVKDLKIGIEPVQDLHGYENPWPAGGGKNLCPLMNWFNVGYSFTNQGITYTIVENGGVHIEGTATARSNFYISRGVTSPVNPFYLPAGQYTFSVTGKINSLIVASGDNETGNGFPYIEINNLNSVSGTVTDSTKPFLYIMFRVQKNSVVNETVYLQIESGSTATSFAPYSNTCPISGWTGANVTRTGRNLLRVSGTSKEQNGVTWTVNADTSITVSGTATAFTSFFVGYAMVGYKKGNITISGVLNFTNISYSDIWINDINNNRVATLTGFISTDTAITINLDNYPNAYKVGVNLKRTTNGACSGTGLIQVEAGDTATKLIPYDSSSTTLPISFGSGTTVYGGELDVLTGELKVTWGMEEIDPTWTISQLSANPNGTVFSVDHSVDFLGWTSGPEALCNCFVKGTGVQASSPANSFWWTNARTGYRFVYGKPNNGTSVEEFTQFLTDNTVVVAGTLATPTTLTLDSNTLSTLLGDNCVWTDTGDIISLDYCADTSTYLKNNCEDRKADVITVSASGNVVSIEDGADDMPVKALTAMIELKQDTLGYGSVWMGGTDEQLIPYPYSSTGAKTVNGITFSVAEEGRISAYGTATADADLDLCTDSYDTMLKLAAGQTYAVGLSNQRAGVSNNTAGVLVIDIYTASGVLYHTYTISSSDTFTLPNDGLDYRCRIILRIPNGTALGGIKYYVPKLEKGSTAKKYKPYENIRPIAGRTQANIRVTGKNLLPNDSSIIADGIESNVYVGYDTYIPNGTRLIASFTDNDDTVSISGIYFGYTDIDYFYRKTNNRDSLNDWEFRWTVSNGIVSTAKTNLSNDYATYLGSFFSTKTNAAENMRSLFARYKVMVNLGNVAEPWEPYQGNDYSIFWGDAAGTVYGGFIDVLNGVLTVTHKMLTVTGNETNWTWSASSGNVYARGADILADAAKITGNYIVGKCSMLNASESEKLPASYLQKANLNTGGLCFLDVVNKWGCESATVEALQARLQAWNTKDTPLVIVYKLENPVVYHITPAQIFTLFGCNVIRADCGAVDLKYRADSKLYIDRKIAESTSAIKRIITTTTDSMVAPKNITSGEIIIVNDDLFKATANIANGAALTVGSNVSKLTLAEWVAALVA